MVKERREEHIISPITKDKAYNAS